MCLLVTSLGRWGLLSLFGRAAAQALRFEGRGREEEGVATAG